MGAAESVAKTFRGIGTALRARPKILLLAAAAVAVFNFGAPVAILSIAKRPPNFATFNPWLPRLPEYLASDVPWSNKIDFLSQLAIGWVSADDGQEVDWGVVLDVPTIGRILLTSLVFGTYFALWSFRRREQQACGLGAKAARPAGVAGAMTSIFGLTTGPCTLAGCGVPVLPIVGVAFTGLSSSQMMMLTTISRVSYVVVLSLMGIAVLWLGYRVGSGPPAAPAQPRGTMPQQGAAQTATPATRPDAAGARSGA
jgi:hypothetical protein